MAFCPHCGKSVAEQASKCLSCGGDLEKSKAAARFKGTMIMQPAAAPAAPAPAPAPAAAPVAAPAPIAAPPAVAAMAEPSKAAPSKVAKHTMLGTGGPGLGPALLADLQKLKAGAAAAPPVAPPPPMGSNPDASAARMTDPALADTARDPAKSQPAPADPDDVAEAPTARMLAGDPMAEKTAPATRERRAVRDDDDDMPTVVPGGGAKPMIIVALVGVVLIALAGYIAARVMGLTH